MSLRAAPQRGQHAEERYFRRYSARYWAVDLYVFGLRGLLSFVSLRHEDKNRVYRQVPSVGGCHVFVSVDRSRLSSLADVYTVYTEFCLRTPREVDHLETQGLDGYLRTSRCSFLKKKK